MNPAVWFVLLVANLVGLMDMIGDQDWIYASIALFGLAISFYGLWRSLQEEED